MIFEDTQTLLDNPGSGKQSFSVYSHSKSGMFMTRPLTELMAFAGSANESTPANAFSQKFSASICAQFSFANEHWLAANAANQ